MNKLFSSKSTDFENEALDIHNQYRRDHGAPALVLNKDMCKLSQKWAEELANKDAMSYSQNKKYGENIYCGSPLESNVKITAKDCVDKWYSQISDYPFGREPELLTTGMFTQVIWKDTKELGVGSAKSKSGKLYVVANYFPPGNFKGQFSNNVLPPGANQFRSTYKTPSTTLPKGTVVSKPITVTSQNDPPPKVNSATHSLISKFKSTSISSDKFEQDCLDSHNSYRRKHGVPPLVYSKKLAKYAEEWAKVLVKKGKMEHRHQNDYGENIYYAWSSDPNYKVNGADAVDNWYSEIKDHTFGREITSLASGHFTQVIWADSKEVGVGTAKSNDGHVYVVANYHPPGNMVGSFAKKVPPPL